MKRVLVIGIMVVALAAGVTRAQSPRSGEAQMKAAQQKAEVEGDLRGAIDEYKKAIALAGNNRGLTAQAWLRIAECYQKLGDAEARAIYEKILREYGDQTAVAAAARGHLDNQAGTAAAKAMAARRVWDGPEVAEESNVSPDGRFVSYPAWQTGDLGLRDLVTRTNRLLTNNGYTDNQYAQGSAFSADGKQIAYAWYNGKDRYELRVVNVESAGLPTPRRLFDNADVDFLVPFDWSADGRWISVWLQRKDRTSQIGLVSVADGSLRVLKSIEWRGVIRMSLSPDSRFLAFDAPASDTNANERDVFLIAVDGSRETQVVSAAGHDQVVGWSPDGRTLLFASDRTGALSLWGVAIANAQPQGAAFLVKADIAGTSIGITRRGELFTVAMIGAHDVKTVSVDLNGGKVLGVPQSTVRTFVGVSRWPDWSPDGKSLAYLSLRGIGGRDRVIVIRTLATGETREVFTELLNYSGSLRWTPDGRSFITKGRDIKGQPGVFLVDALSGALTRLVDIPSESGNSVPELSPDGKKLYFWQGAVLRGNPGSRFLERDLVSGQERTLWSGGEGPIYPSLSPDGRSFAGIIRSEDPKSSALVVVPLTGEQPRQLLRVSDTNMFSNAVSWSRDGSFVIVPARAGGAFEPMVVPINGDEPRRLNLEIGQPGVRLHPDNRQLAFSAGTQSAELWVLENFLPVQTTKR